MRLSGHAVRIRAAAATNWLRIVILGFAFGTGALYAQPVSNSRPAFEVASVKRSSEPLAGILRVEKGNFTYGNGLRLLIAWAYGVPLDQVIAPDWTQLANTVVRAKAGRPVSNDQVRLMLQTLLEERFKLRVHRETKETSVAALMVAGKGAPRLKPSLEGETRHLFFDEGKQQEIVTAYTMREFVDWLAQFYHGTIDRTGLPPGRYDFVLDYRHLGDPLNPGAAAFPALRARLRFDALEQIGLKLALVKAPLEFIVVDQVEKYPTAN
jgi:uncharacterized protein (TIGR03435 family)